MESNESEKSEKHETGTEEEEKENLETSSNAVTDGHKQDNVICKLRLM